MRILIFEEGFFKEKKNIYYFNRIVCFELKKLKNY